MSRRFVLTSYGLESRESRRFGLRRIMRLHNGWEVSWDNKGATMCAGGKWLVLAVLRAMWKAMRI